MAFKVRFGSAKDDVLEFFRESAVRNAELAVEEINNGLREIECCALFIDVFFGQVVLNHEECHIADNFGGRCNFDDIAEEHVDSCIHAADFWPAFAEAYSGCLLAQVAELSARHFMLVECGVRAAHLGIDACIVRAYSCQ